MIRQYGPRRLLALAISAAVAIVAGAAKPVADPLCAPVAGSEAERDARLEGRGCRMLVAEGPEGREQLVAGDLGPGSWSWGRIVEADVVLLGEVHDNSGHHRRRASLLRAIVRSRGELPARRIGGSVVMEQIRADQRPGLDAFHAGSAQTSAELFRLVQWDESGWPPQSLFAPIVDAALELSLPIRAGDPPRALVRAVARQGMGALPVEDRVRLGLDVDLEPPLAGALAAELAGSHCGLLPQSAFAGMAAAQRLRDAHLAEVLLGDAKTRGASFLIAGNGHVRKDRGVPWHIARRDPRLRAFVVMLVEAPPGTEDAGPLVPRDPGGRLAADIVLFTAPTERPDPCAAMREQMKAVPRP